MRGYDSEDGKTLEIDVVRNEGGEVKAGKIVVQSTPAKAEDEDAQPLFKVAGASIASKNVPIIVS